MGEIEISCGQRTIGKDMKVLQEHSFVITSELKGYEHICRNLFFISSFIR